ncbi:MAG TPA: hypothetical protein VNZ58_01235 [Thermomicrobiales bacterium]|nr:hypothetical protein [Thermomicrobiales bacterium]
MARTLYRIVNTNPPGEDDFKSYSQLGKRAFRQRPELERLMSGLSMLSTLEAARARGMGNPWKSRGHVAELSLPEDERVRIEQTTSDPFHYTVWADESLLRASIVRVVPIVEEDPQNV